VKYNRQALIEACDKALERDRVDWHKRRAEQLGQHSRAVAEWSRKYADEWAQAGLEIRRAIRKGEPVTKDMLPTSRRYHDNPAWFYPQFDPNREYRVPEELAFLRHVLDIVTDDVVTTSGLAQVGVSVRMMKDAAWYMAVGSARE